ncbi:MAG: protein kinase [Akkermansiaceae bacterium]|nr:protein kinase [Akkermansiaceae bacterium]
MPGKSIYSQLYEEAGQQPLDLSGSPTETLCPLYCALGRIEDRYELEEEIGVGGMKQVLRVYDRQTERHVAMARPKADVTPERYDAFLREGHITSRLEHPNIIKLFDMGIDESKRPFFTMEYKRGLSLRKILSFLQADKHLEEYSTQKRLSIFLRVCEAIAYAHSRHVLHLDLKPENIQVGTFGEVQVCDWGLGEIERKESEQHSSEALLDPDLYGDQLEPPIKGTPGYMAPEQDNSRASKTMQTDIYALGCLLYELDTLHPPESRFKKPSHSKAITAIITKACAENPDDRYRQVENMWEDVNRHLMGFSVGAERTGFGREILLFYRRHKLPSLITVFFTVFLLGVALFFTQKLQTSHGATKQALERTEDALTSAKQERDRAELSLDRYLKEKEYAEALLNKHSADTIDSTVLLVDDIILNESLALVAVQKAMEGLDKKLASNPPAGDRTWGLKAYLLFITQRFEEAGKLYSRRVGGQRDLLAMTPEFAPLVREDGLLPPKDFIRLMERLTNIAGNNRAMLVEKMVIYDSLIRQSDSEKATIVREVLKLGNPHWKNQVFIFDGRRMHLEIGGQGLMTLYRPNAPPNKADKLPLSILRVLRLRSLDLHASQLRDLDQLRGLQLTELDLSNMPAKDLAPLATMKSLRVLKIRRGQYGQVQLESLPGQVTVQVLAQGEKE